MGQVEILELLVSVGCSSTGGAERIGVQSNAETVRGAGKNVAVEQKCERFRGRWTKILERVFFSFSAKLPIFSLSDVSE